MQTQVVLTFIGADRPGLVESLSRVIANHRGNWLESRLMYLSGKFAGVAHVSLPKAELAGFLSATQALADVGLRVVAEPANEASVTNGNHMRLHVVGLDRPGIVHEFAQALAERKINVLELSSDISSAPMAGGPLFMATANIELPDHLDVDELHDELDLVAIELTVEFTLEEAD